MKASFFLQGKKDSWSTELSESLIPAWAMTQLKPTTPPPLALDPFCSHPYLH